MEDKPQVTPPESTQASPGTPVPQASHPPSPPPDADSPGPVDVEAGAAVDVDGDGHNSVDVGGSVAAALAAVLTLPPGPETAALLAGPLTEQAAGQGTEQDGEQGGEQGGERAARRGPVALERGEVIDALVGVERLAAWVDYLRVGLLAQVATWEESSMSSQWQADAEEVSAALGWAPTCSPPC